MGIKRSTKKMVDLRKAPKDIIDSVRKSKGIGSKIEGLSKVSKKLTQFLRSDVLRESK